MKKLFLCLAAVGMLLAGCGSNDEEEVTPNNQEQPGNNPDNPNDPDNPDNPDNPNIPDEAPPIPDLPPMSDNSDDVCTAMDDIHFMNYCYDNFDVNKDGKVTRTEAAAVRKIDITSLGVVSIQGIGYFSNLETFIGSKNPLREAELRLNTKLSSALFTDCSSMTVALLPENLTVIGSSAFSWCTNLEKIFYSQNLESIGQSAFYYCKNLHWITIPDSVTKIGESAFYDCSGLTSVTIPDSVTYIGDRAFYGCSSLTCVTIGNSVTQIGDSVFYGCSSLTEIYCQPTTPPSLGSIVFYNMSAKIYVPRASVDTYKAADGWSSYASKIEGYDF